MGNIFNNTICLLVLFFLILTVGCGNGVSGYEDRYSDPPSLACTLQKTEFDAIGVCQEVGVNNEFVTYDGETLIVRGVNYSRKEIILTNEENTIGTSPSDYNFRFIELKKISVTTYKERFNDFEILMDDLGLEIVENRKGREGFSFDRITVKVPCLFEEQWANALKKEDDQIIFNAYPHELTCNTTHDEE